MADPQQIVITLNPNGVSAPVQRVVIIASEVVAIALRALAKDDLSQPDMQGGMFGYRFGGLEWDEVERRQTFENWILSKGFQDLARGIRETLEEAALYLEIFSFNSGPTTAGYIDERISKARRKASKLSFPDLLQSVNKKLKEPINFEAEFLSLQKVRNCLEHRGGRVGPSDIDQLTGSMILSFPRIRLFYVRGEEEIELAVGEAIDTQSPENPIKDADGQVNILLNRVTRSREYKLGEPVVILASDFYEIAMACNIFAADLASKLPTNSTIPESVLLEPLKPHLVNLEMEVSDPKVGDNG